VKAISLNSILEKLERIDLIDADIQGSEAAVFEASTALLNARVRKVHIETHSPEQEARLRILFSALSWEPVFDYPAMTTSQTPWGPIHFQGGVQVWTNPRLASGVSDDPGNITNRGHH